METAALFVCFSFLPASNVTSSTSVPEKNSKNGAYQPVAWGKKKILYSLVTLNATGVEVLLLSHGRLTVS